MGHTVYPKAASSHAQIYEYFANNYLKTKSKSNSFAVFRILRNIRKSTINDFLKLSAILKKYYIRDFEV